MKKMLLVLCVVMMGSLFASATHYTVTLNSFCDSWDLNLNKGYNFNTGLPFPTKVYVWGHHDVPAVCTGTFETIGMKHGAGSTVPPNNLFGTSNAVFDISDTEGGSIPVEFLIRVTNGCGAAAYLGGDAFGVASSVFVNEDTCTVGPAPTRVGLKPMIPR
jgi:hypothetical protein